jgi:hypothetical protein
MMRPFCVTPQSGELPNACKIHGFDHCSFDATQSTSYAYRRLYSTVLAAAALVVATVSQ